MSAGVSKSADSVYFQRFAVYDITAAHIIACDLKEHGTLFNAAFFEAAGLEGALVILSEQCRFDC